MTKSGRVLAVATLVGAMVGLAGVTAAAFEGRAGAVPNAQPSEVAAERIAAAFAAVLPQRPAPAIEAAARRLAKGDGPERRDCAAERWPDISSDCLVGSADIGVRRVRTVTIGHQDGEATTVLVRIPVPQVATR
jgi:hypothetical protein